MRKACPSNDRISRASSNAHSTFESESIPLGSITHCQEYSCDGGDLNNGKGILNETRRTGEGSAFPLKRRFQYPGNDKRDDWDMHDILLRRQTEAYSPGWGPTSAEDNMLSRLRAT